MRILVLSDSHGSEESVRAALQAAGKIDFLLHCGDGWRDLPGDLPLELPVLRVRGNSDIDTEMPLQRIFDVEETRFFLTHGHMQQVKQGLLPLSYAARAAGATVACFGHTHQSCIVRDGDLWLINPGSAGRGRTCALLQLNKGDLQAEILHF